MGGYLATAPSAIENDYIFSLVSDPLFWVGSGSDFAGPFLGGFQLPNSPEPDGGWQWVTGEPFDFTNWAPGEEPNNWMGREDKLQLFGKGQIASTWNDTLPETARLGFVVEWESIPEPPSVALGLVSGGILLSTWRRSGSSRGHRGR